MEHNKFTFSTRAMPCCFVLTSITTLGLSTTEFDVCSFWKYGMGLNELVHIGVLNRRGTVGTPSIGHSLLRWRKWCPCLGDNNDDDDVDDDDDDEVDDEDDDEVDVDDDHLQMLYNIINDDEKNATTLQGDFLSFWSEIQIHIK
eukprot:m.142115 g.142115  ORF g.142115 m.142115 type:complete len:144 (-) comp30231_c3_seq5:41-472(-)